MFSSSTHKTASSTLQREVRTDVLIVGGGAAGLCAAIAAAEEGRKALVLFKSGGNATTRAAGGFAAVMPGPSADDSVRMHVENTLSDAAGLADPRLVEAFAAGAGPALCRIMDWGVRFYTTQDGALRRFSSGGHSAARTYRCFGGRTGNFQRILLRRARALGVAFLSNCELVSLAGGGGRVLGGFALDAAGERLSIAARAVVLATGGYAALFARHTTAPGMTGEGLEMALEAGAALTDLEFVQFMPTALAWPPEFQGKIINDTLRGEGAVLRDVSGERFMPRYSPRYGDRAGRDVLAMAMARETAHGRGTPHGGVWLDATGIAEKNMRECFNLVDRLRARGIDPAADWMEVTPAAHFTCGGIRIEPDCSTGVEGLFAAGEVTAGLHGANRLGANALSETLIFGDRAGRTAAAYAARVGNDAQDRPAPPLCFEEPYRPLAHSTPDAASDAENRLKAWEEGIRDSLWLGAGLLRRRESLETARLRLQAVEAEMLDAPAARFSLRENVRRLRQIRMARLAARTVMAAQQREESRGTHCREDYPERNENWTRHIEWRKGQTMG